MKWCNSTVSSTNVETEDEQEHENVRTVGNDIYFYGEINNENVMELMCQLKTLTVELQKKAIDAPGYEPYINLHICSEGGDIFSGLSAMDNIYANPVWVNTIAEGCCASAATFLLLGGHSKYVSPHSYILIHQISNEFWGKYEELKDELKSCKKFMKMIRTIYEKYTNIPKVKLDNMMKRDIYLSAKQAKKYRIVDGDVWW